MFRKLATIVCIVSILTLQVNVFEAHATGWSILPSITTSGITAGESVPILSGAASTFNPYIIGAAVAGVAILAGYAWYTSRGNPVKDLLLLMLPKMLIGLILPLLILRSRRLLLLALCLRMLLSQRLRLVLLLTLL